MLKILKTESNINENRLKSIRDAHNKKERQEQEQEQLRTNRMEDYLEVIYDSFNRKGTLRL